MYEEALQSLPLSTREEEAPRARYRVMKSQIARQAMMARVKAGECPGIAPLGYRNVFVNGRRTVAVDEMTAPFIAEAFRMAARRGSSLRKILAQLTPQGLAGKNGKPMAVSSLQAILTNPFYAGLVRLNGEAYRGSHQPLVSKCLFDRVHRSLFRRRCR